MKRKKAVSVFLAASMTCGLFAVQGITAAAEEYTQIVYAYATFNNIPSEADLDVVEEAINEITREKIGAEITLKPISIADYSSSVSLSLQAGEQIDVFETLGDFNNCVATGMAYDLTDLMDEYAAETKELMGEAWLEACSQDGSLYGLPTYKPIALTPMVIYREDIAEELGLDMDSVNSYEDLTEILRAVEEAYPDMTPLGPTQSGTVGAVLSLENIDYLTDDYYQPVGVLIDYETTLVDLYSSDLFRERCELVRSWYEEGLVMQDAATTTSDAAELMSSGNYFCYVASYSYPEEDTAASLEAQCGGYSIGAKIIGEAYLDTSDINALTWMVASNSKNAETALAFLNLTFTDEDICNLLIYGIEGRDYVWNDDGTVSYPEGEDSTTVPYTAQLSCGTLGNYFIMYPLEGTDPDSLEWELEQNQSAKTSVAMGFTFDSSSLKTQYTAVANVIAQYLPGLECGSLDPETEIDNFVNALNNAGYQDILNAKQEQLDAWLAEQ